MADEGGQSRITLAQDPEEPWETKGSKGQHKARNHLAKDHFHASVETSSQQIWETKGQGKTK